MLLLPLTTTEEVSRGARETRQRTRTIVGEDILYWVLVSDQNSSETLHVAQLMKTVPPGNERTSEGHPKVILRRRSVS